MLINRRSPASTLCPVARKMSRYFLVAFALVASAATADTPKATPPKANQTAGGYSGLGSLSVSPQDVARYAAPALDATKSRRIQSMLDVRGTGVGLTTSRGDRQVFSWPITGVTQVWRQDGPLKFPVQLTGGEDATLAVALAHDDSFIVVSRDVGGQQTPGLYLLSLDGGPLRLVQQIPAVQTELQYISDDSKAIYIRANDKDPASFVIYRYDIAKSQREAIFEEQGVWRIADHRGDSSWLLVKQLGNTQQEVYEYDLQSKKLTSVLGQGEFEEYDVAYGARKRQILVRTNKFGEFQRLYALEAGKLTPVTPALGHDVDDFRIDQARQRIYYGTNEGGYARLSVLDARTLKPTALPKLPAAENVWLVGLSRNSRFAEFAFDGATLVPQARTLDWQTGAIATWRVPNAPELDTRTFTRATLESYPARDGSKIPMLVWRPVKCDLPCPVVVQFHGGPADQTRPGFARHAQLFVDAGFTFVTPNVRGSIGYGKTYSHADDGEKRLAVITDIEDAATFIRARWGANGKAPKIGVMGGSYGGYAALMAMTYFAGAYDAGVSEVGMSDLNTFLTNTAPYRRRLRYAEYGDPITLKGVLKQLSPVTYIDRFKGPLLILQGVNDPRVPVGESVQLQRLLEARGVPSNLILFPDEGHGTARRSNVALSVGHTIAFFEKHLLGK